MNREEKSGKCFKIFVSRTLPFTKRSIQIFSLSQRTCRSLGLYTEAINPLIVFSSGSIEDFTLSD